ncbi:MFS transporter [Nocardioides sp. T2.26MG-1]|uniref:MFS transporter n=1 Tax=Nocardioides sp. T2.26MG-1 TaxID=3041166 RepID=UPI002477C6D3|nr:aromatic acid/H+ symport family MFS transporter [Nocardioides sp. T2.26MG-1]CAI9410497.1 Gentisate transporter [Nocardioides sp. T2.26MG-1]
MTTTTPAPTSVAQPTRRRSATTVIVLCWLIVVFDGYDLIVYGTTIPALLAEPGWGLTPGTAGTIGSLAFVGMLVGALTAGSLADRLGRRRTIIGCVAWFTAFTGLCSIAPSPEAFGMLRFLAGVGLGGLVPSANALTSEFVTARRRSVVSTVMMSGVPIGGSLAALIGIRAIPALGWQSMYAFAFSGVVLLVLVVALLPESPSWLRAHGRDTEATDVERRFGVAGLPHTASHHRPGLRTLLRPPFAGATVLFALASIATLLAWYGLGTWLPKLMAGDERFDLGSNPLTFLLALNLGAVAGSVVTAWAATRVGPLPSAVGAAAAAAAGLAFLVTYPSSVTLVYAALILAGVGTHGTQCLIISAVATHYPAQLRGASLGFALGAGRIGAVAAPQLGGWLLGAGFGVGSNFLLFAGAAAASAVLLLVTHLATRPASTRAVVGELAH